MKTSRQATILILLAVLGRWIVSAAEFQPIGSVALSMGGAGVACSTGPYAAYYNPALLSQSKHGAEFVLAAGVGYREMNLVETADRLADIDIGDTLDELERRAGEAISGRLQQDLLVIQEELASLSEKNGFQLMPAVSFALQVGRVCVGAYGVCEATAHAVIDRSRLAFVVENHGRYFAYDPTTGGARETSRAEYENTSLQYAIDNRLTHIQLKGLAYLEMPVAYGHRFETRGKNVLGVGGALKLMPAVTYDLKMDIDTESDDLMDEFENSEKTGVAYGADIGILFKPALSQNLTLAVVGKNLNSPEFDTITGDKLKIAPQFRAGIACECLDQRISLALDMDLTSNETFLPGLESQFIGGGVNFHPVSWFSLRCGVMQNLAESDDGTILTAGLGLGLKWFQLDFSGQVSTEQSEYEGTAIPRIARAQISVISKWK